MFGFLSRRWQKASECKKVLQQLQSRLKFRKNKKDASLRDLRLHIALFIRINDHARALLRTKQLVLVENSVSTYDLLLHFTDFILLHFTSIRKHRELLDDDISEAVLSLVFASATYGEELPELVTIKELFGERYGENYVNLKIKEKLSVTLVPEESKSKLVDELEKEAAHRLEKFMLEYKPEIKRQVIEEEEKKVIDTDLNSCSDMPPEVYKSTLTDMEEEKSKRETSRDDDFIEEVQVGRDQRVFRCRDSREEDRSPLSLLRGFKDMQTSRYYQRQKRIRRTRKRSLSSSSSTTHCYNIVYNVNSVKKEKEGDEEERRPSPKHVHPKLPDYDQIVTQFKSLRTQHCMHSQKFKA